ncbi:MAG: PfkB family carbohydrate kinase [Acidobacteriota bacterium]|nr:PfkB family carbohydrate kinase [Acidobacteriota bacterium]
MWKGQIIHCLPHTVSPIDTTGADDSFDAGFLNGWLDNQPPLGCLRLGNLCGALSTTGLGGVATFPTRQRAEELLAQFK